MAGNLHLRHFLHPATGSGTNSPLFECISHMHIMELSPLAEAVRETFRSCSQWRHLSLRISRLCHGCLLWISKQTNPLLINQPFHIIDFLHHHDLLQNIFDYFTRAEGPNKDIKRSEKSRHLSLFMGCTWWNSCLFFMQVQGKTKNLDVMGENSSAHTMIAAAWAGRQAGPPQATKWKSVSIRMHFIIG